MKKDKKRWGLETKTMGKLSSRIEFDYLKKLKDSEKEWLEAFNLAVAKGKFKPLEKLGVKLTPDFKNTLNSERYLADLCNPASHEARLQAVRKTQTLKFKMNLAKEMLSDIPDIDFEIALSEAKAVFKEGKK